MQRNTTRTYYTIRNSKGLFESIVIIYVLDFYQRTAGVILDLL
jgi:hypothetical protein